MYTHTSSENLQKGTQIAALRRIQTQSLVARRESLGKNTADAALTNEVEPAVRPARIKRPPHSKSAAMVGR